MTMRTLRAMCGVALMLMLTLTVTPMRASAQEDAHDREDGQLQEESSKRSSGNGKLVGVWDVRVTNRECQTGDPTATTPPLRVMNMFNRGGTLLETGVVAQSGERV